MLFSLINYGTLLLLIIGAVICHIVKSQNENTLYKYGFWAFVVFFISRLIGLAQPFMLSPGMGQDMVSGGMHFLITVLNLFRELLGIAAYLILVVGFYKSLENEKRKEVRNNNF